MAQLAKLQGKDYYIRDYEPAQQHVYSQIRAALEDEYPGSGPYSTALCEFTEDELNYFSANVQKPTLADNGARCYTLMEEAISLASTILRNRPNDA
jgi:hypothetical protein